MTDDAQDTDMVIDAPQAMIDRMNNVGVTGHRIDLDKERKDMNAEGNNGKLMFMYRESSV